MLPLVSHKGQKGRVWAAPSGTQHTSPPRAGGSALRELGAAMHTPAEHAVVWGRGGDECSTIFYKHFPAFLVHFYISYSTSSLLSLTLYFPF